MSMIAMQPSLDLKNFSRTAAVGDAPLPLRDAKANGVMPTSENIAENKNVFVSQVAQRTAAAISPADDTLKPSIQPPSVEFDKTQLQDQLKHVAFTAPTQQLATASSQQPKQEWSFSISNVVGSHQMQLARLQDIIVSALQKSQQADTVLGNSLQKMAVEFAHQSADHTRDAGKAAASGSISSGAIGIAGAGFGLHKAGKSYTQGKFGISQQRNSLNFQKQAKTLNGNLQKTPQQSGMSQAELHDDRAIIAGGSQQPMEYKSQSATVQAQVHQNRAAKLNAHSTASTQIGNMSGQIAASPFQVEQANENAAATLSDNDKQVTDNTHSKTDENKRRSEQMQQQLMTMINGVITEEANTAGALASTRV